MKKRVFAMVAVALVITTLFACGKEEAEANAQESESAALLTGTQKIQIDIKDYGTIIVSLDADSAPITVTNFMSLVDAGFYDGLTFHRIIEGFMMQGGDPTGTGVGGSDNTIKGEFAANGVDNPIQHKRGTISMARSMDPNSASSQFFICHEDCPSLDGQYAAFGQVESGIEVVDEICKNTPVIDGNGTVEAKNQPVIERIINITDK